jgi:hypothetical protein
MPYTTRDLLTEAYRDVQVLPVGETLDADQSAQGLLFLARLFDDWNAERAGVYANRLTTHTLTPSLNPQTIGTNAATFTVTQRPVSIDWANLVVSDVRYPLNLRGSQWWAGLTQPLLTTSMPTDLHYEADWPNGNIYLYPVPDSAYGLELMTRVVLADLALSDTVSMPPGYRNAIILTIGEMIAATYPPAVANPDGAAKARARIYANNDETPPLMTRDAGLPGGRRRWWNWESGLWQ